MGGGLGAAAAGEEDVTAVLAHRDDVQLAHRASASLYPALRRDAGLEGFVWSNPRDVTPVLVCSLAPDAGRASAPAVRRRREGERDYGRTAPA